MERYNFSELVEIIRREVKLVDVARSLGIDVDYGGSKYKKVLCPFHKDKKPSLTLYVDRYHCFGCNAYGDVFNLVGEIKNLSFKEAVKWLADFKGYRLPEYSLKTGIIKGEFRSGLEFGYSLYKKRASIDSLKKWCEKRNIDYETVKKHGILGLNRNPITSGLKQKLSKAEEGALVDAGLIKLVRPKDKFEPGSDKYLDLNSIPKDIFWYKSIIFPIFDEFGNLQGFAARENGDKKYEGPKYRYTRGFKRAKNLYGIDRVVEKARKYLSVRKKDKGLHEPFDLFITEGFTDALRLESLDFNAVAVLGSSLSGKFDEKDSQLGLLKNLADTLQDIPLNLHLFFDNDEAGKNGMKRAIPKILERGTKVDNVIFLDVIQPSIKCSGKDPDDLLKNVLNKEEARQFLENWNRSVVDFFVSDILDCQIDELDAEYKKLNVLQKAQLKNRIEAVLGTANETLCQVGLKKIKEQTEPPGWEKLYLGEKPKFLPAVDEKKKRLSDSDFFDALSLVEHGYKGIDFPIDFGSFERLKKAGLLLKNELAEHLRSNEEPFLEPCIPILTPREQGGSPRLKVLPCIEDLIVQEYVLNKLLTTALKHENTIPAVIHKPDLNNGKIITVGRRKNIPANDITVSFAYQVNASALKAGGTTQETTFRHFGECWKSFNDFVLGRVSRSPLNVLYPARLDIRRFYDEIPRYAVRDVLKPALEDACNVEKNSLVPGVDTPEKNAPGRATEIMDWIIARSFSYEFYLPNGVEVQWLDAEKGIPQGPNLSAWLANIVLFPVDKRLSREVEKINEEYWEKWETDPGHLENTIFATYARYVDDVIIIAPDESSRTRLQQLFAYEIGELGLGLSPKTTPLEPQEKDELRGWLMENRGLGQQPYGAWEPSDLHFANVMFKSFWVENIDRKEALSLLHNKDLDRGIFDKKEIKHILDIVCKKSEELRYRDYRQVAKRIWQIVADEYKDETDLKKVVEQFKDEWDINEKQETEEIPGEPEPRKHFSKLEDFHIPIKKAWPLFSCLEGIQALLQSRMDRALFIDEESRKQHYERRATIGYWIRDGLLNKIVDDFGIEQKYLDELLFMLELRKLSILQAVGMITGEDAFNNRPETDIKSPQKTLNAIARYSYHALKPVEFEKTRTYNAYDKFESFLLFHEIIERLCFDHDIDGDDPLKPVKQNCKTYFEENDSSYLARSLYCLCPSEEINDEKNIKYSKYILQSFANCVVSKERQFYLLGKRPYLIKLFCGEEAINMFILPQPGSTPLKAIQIVNITDEKQINRIYLLVESNGKNNDYEFLENTLPSLSSEEWSEIDDNPLHGISCYFQKTSSFKLPVFGFIKESPKLEKKIDILYHAFKDLVNIDRLEDYLITPYNIIKRDSYTVFSPPIEQKEIKPHAFSSKHYFGIEQMDIPAENAHLWRIGTALAGLLNLYEEIGSSDSERFQRDTASGLNKNDLLTKSILVNALYILTGSKWRSKPKPNRENENGITRETTTKLPWAVENCLGGLKRFMDSKTPMDSEISPEKIAVWLNIRADKLLMSICYKDESLFVPGCYAQIMSDMAGQLLQAKVFLLEELVSKFAKGSEDYRNYRRTTAYCLKIIDILNGLDNEVKGKGSLNRIKAVFKIRAINNHFRSLTVELRKKTNKTFETCFSAVHRNMNIFESDNEVLLSTKLKQDHDDIDFFRFLDREFDNANISKTDLNTVTPSGWIVAAWTGLSFLLQDDKKIKLEKVGTQLIEIFDRISFIIDDNSDNYPWLINDGSIRKIEKAFEITFPKKNLAKELDELADLEIILAKNSSQQITAEKSISFRADNNETWDLKHWQFYVERMQGDNQQEKFEQETTPTGKKLFYWTETWHKDTLLSVSLLSESYRYLFKSCVTEPAQDQESPSEKLQKDSQTQEPEKSIDAQTLKEETITGTGRKVKTQEKTEPAISSGEEARSKTGSIDDMIAAGKIAEFKSIQEELWKDRDHRFGRHIRVALCQLDVDESYSHPLREICETQNHDFMDKCKLTINELKKTPWKYDEKLGLVNGGKPRMLISCAEYRRRKKLSEVFRACKHFKVDLLLLPEYSVRPETVEWINEQLTIGPFSGVSLTVWCGTYRQPYYVDAGKKNREVEQGEEYARMVLSSPIKSLAAPLHVVSSDKLIFETNARWKKYPAVALAELFNPYPAPLVPLYTSKMSASTQRYYPGDYVLELICSENFALTSPMNRNGILQALFQLNRIFGLIDAKDFKKVKETLDSDLATLSKWASLSPSLEDRKPTDWMGYSPRRTVLFVPAMTRRSEDFHILGQANLLAAGMCTVFCNAVLEHHSDGRSCFIGHGSWNKNHNPTPYYDDRLGPYNGVFPGIYRTDQPESGALGKKDQALVIADIDPVYMTEGKPRHQMLQHPLQLIAHLPIIEITNQNQDKKQTGENIPQCTCSRKRIEYAVLEHILLNSLQLMKGLKKKKISHAPEKEIIKFLEKIAEKYKDSWLKKRAEAYRNKALVKLSELPPPAIYDWLFVFSDKTIGDAGEEPNCYIEVPPFSAEKDDIEIPGKIK